MSASHDKDLKPEISPGSILFLLIHVMAVVAFFYGFDLTWFLIGIGLFVIRMFGITAGYHRYFSHRSFKTSRFFQFILGFIGCSSAQKGPLWWAAHHRHHHQHSDTPEDVHSMKEHGVYWSHVGWVLSNEYTDYNSKLVRDLEKCPELVWMDKNHFIPPLILVILCSIFGGWNGFFWGFCFSTVLLYHATFAINSICHYLGRQRYETGDASKNSFLLAILTLGEGWHNNHHYYPAATRQGFFWWEIDISFYVLKFLSMFNIVWDLKEPPHHVRENTIKAAKKAEAAAVASQDEPADSLPPKGAFSHGS